MILIPTHMLDSVAILYNKTGHNNMSCCINNDHMQGNIQNIFYTKSSEITA